MPIYVTIAIGWASWFEPSHFSPALHVRSPYVCAMNRPVDPGSNVIVEDTHNGRTSHCIVTGSGPCCGRVIDVSPMVRDELGFTGLAAVRVYRVTGHLPRCKLTPQPQTCKTPPTACVLDLPKPAILQCSTR